MTHHESAGEVMERAALYALGALPPEEAVAFEAHLAEGCRACQAEVKGFEATAAQLGYAAAPEPPRPEVRDRLMTYALAGFAQSAWTVVRATEGEWRSGAVPGVTHRELFRDPDARRFTALVRIEPGVRYPSHEHADTEELYMLTGDLTVEGQELWAGDYCAAAAHTTHAGTYSRAGCTFLIHASEEDRLRDEDPEKRSQTGLLFVRSAERAWEATRDEGVTRRSVFSDRVGGTSTYLVRMEPGARLRSHQHVSAEQFYMIEGDGHVAGVVLGPGDYYRAAAGTVHQVSYTEGGCTFLVLSSRAEALS